MSSRDERDRGREDERRRQRASRIGSDSDEAGRDRNTFRGNPPGNSQRDRERERGTQECIKL